MNQEFANKIKLDFRNLTSIDCSMEFMSMGAAHEPSRLLPNEQGVYVFLSGEHSFKVGKAGSNSQARWNSHHYNLDEKTPSTFPKSFMADLNNFKTYFSSDKHHEMENLNSQNIKMWVRNNLSRIEYKISSEESKISLNLLEALVQYNFQPIYEGRKKK